MPDYKDSNEGLHIWYLIPYMRGATQPDQCKDKYIMYTKIHKKMLRIYFLGDVFCFSTLSLNSIPIFPTFTIIFSLPSH